MFLKISQNSQETCARVSSLIKLQAWCQALAQVFLNFAKFSRTSFLHNTSRRLLLKNENWIWPDPPEQGGQGGRLPTKVFCQCALFFEEHFKCVLFERSNQKCTWKSILYTSKLKKHTILLLIGFYQVEHIKSETLFNSIKDALCQIDD